MHRAALLVLASLRASDAYPATASPATSVEVVIAHYDEDLAWLRNETDGYDSSLRLIVYHKKPMLDRIRQSLEREPLRGREEAQPQVRRLIHSAPHCGVWRPRRVGYAFGATC